MGSGQAIYSIGFGHFIFKEHIGKHHGAASEPFVYKICRLIRLFHFFVLIKQTEHILLNCAILKANVTGAHRNRAKRKCPIVAFH